MEVNEQATGDLGNSLAMTVQFSDSQTSSCPACHGDFVLFLETEYIIYWECDISLFECCGVGMHAYVYIHIFTCVSPTCCARV